MRIEWFKAQGFRSLRDVEIDGLGPFNVFYGPNGAGKSNLLAAMQLLFSLLMDRARPEYSLVDPTAGWPPNLDARDRCQIAHGAPGMVLSARLAWTENETNSGSKPSELRALTVEVAHDWDRRIAHVSRLEANHINLFTLQPLKPYAREWTSWFKAARQRAIEFGERFDQRTYVLKWLGFPVEDQPTYLRRLQTVVRGAASSAFMLINADRMPRPEQNTKGKQSIVELLTAGRLKEALLRASKHPDRSIREGYKALGQLLQDPPFNQPPFEMTEDPETGRIELVETVTDPARGARDVPLDLVGLGVAQVYYILARALLGNTRTAAIEEPEAHLHAPTTGIELRQVLERLVNEGYLDQLFIATHSNLFDLDPDGYFDVSFDPERGTQVQRKQLDQIDIDHLYEPGPAKHILQRLLRRMDENTVLFRRPDGSPISIREMLELLQRDDPLAKEFLNDVHGAAVHAVRIKNKTPAPASET